MCSYERLHVPLFCTVCTLVFYPAPLYSGGSTRKKVSFCLGEYGHGYNDFVNGAFKPGTNDLDAFEACIECGACSEDKFLESDEYNDFKTGEIIGSIVGGVVGFIGLIVCLCCFCKGSWHFYNL